MTRVIEGEEVSKLMERKLIGSSTSVHHLIEAGRSETIHKHSSKIIMWSTVVTRQLADVS